MKKLELLVLILLVTFSCLSMQYLFYSINPLFEFSFLLIFFYLLFQIKNTKFNIFIITIVITFIISSSIYLFFFYLTIQKYQVTKGILIGLSIVPIFLLFLLYNISLG